MKANQGILRAHISVLLFGLSAVLAKVISQSAVVVTGSRSFLAAVVIGIFLVLSKRPLWPLKNKVGILLVSGGLLAFHWITFYMSVKVSSVSIAVVTVSTFPVMTAILEPLLLKSEKWSWSLLYAPILIMIGTVILMGDFSTSSELAGMGWGFLSAFIYVIIHLINKVHVDDMGGVELSFFQLFVAGVVLLPFTISGYDASLDVNGTDVVLILILAIFSTAIAYSLFIESMKSISARLAAILCGLEPVYGITIAVLFLGEAFSWNLLIGALIILAAVVWSSMTGEDQEINSTLDSKEVTGTYE